ncbi:MAG TPA: 8-oxoguanine deaminase, partial [Ruania sp.]|nr:8-oxoguanine deaminase [Ruania sp.]
MSTLWLQNPSAIHLGAETPSDAAAGGIVVDSDSGTITELVATGGTPTTPPQQTFDASAHVVTPGLVNTHHHFYQTLTRA